ncbi:MAG: inositol monophosphatase family protein, partial [Candidatus Binatia bacterium]
MLERTRLAKKLALEAGGLIREAMGRRRNVEYKSAVDLVTDVDRAAQLLILDGIHAAFPDDTIIAEEADERSTGHSGVPGPCWYVDPLDGTTNFVHGLPHFAVSIAFFDAGRPVSAAVYDP